MANFTLPRKKDVAGLGRFLSPAFQVQRADGTASEKTEYLTKLPDVRKFTLSQFRATQQGATLVVRYLAVVSTGRRTRPVPPRGSPYSPGTASAGSWPLTRTSTR
jgi:hypothetical protein